MSTHSVYALVDPRTGDIRYVGQTMDIHKRYAQHLLYSSGKRKKVWLEELRGAGLLPTLIVLESNVSGQDIDRREKYWIRCSLAQGFALTNGSTHETQSPKPKKTPRVSEPRVMANKTYAIADLLDNLPCTLKELADKSGVDTSTIRRIQTGQNVRPYQTNRLLITLSQIHNQEFDRSNVTGI